IFGYGREMPAFGALPAAGIRVERRSLKTVAAKALSASSHVLAATCLAAKTPMMDIMPFPNLPPILGEALAARGYAEPTPVQTAVLDPSAAGRDLVVSAQTGSGKTVAFGIAMAPELLQDEGTVAFSRSPLALVI